MRALATAAAITLLPATAALPQTAPPASPLMGSSLIGLAELLLDPDRLAVRFAQFAVMGLRTQMDVTYGDLSADLAGGRATLSDVTLWPLLDWDTGDAACRVDIARLSLSSQPIDRLDVYGMRLSASGIEVTEGCLPPDGPAQIAAMAGLSEIRIPALSLSAQYDIASSALVMSARGEVSDLARVDADVDFAYAWVGAPAMGGDPIPVLFLNGASLSVENLGAWEAFSPVLPAQSRDPATAASFAKSALTGLLQEVNASSRAAMGSGAPARLSEGQRSFVESAALAFAIFVARPDRLVVETSGGVGEYLDTAMIGEDPRELFETFRPRAATAPAASADALPAALLRQALEDPDALSRAARLAAGEALLTGIGAPRDREAAIALLDPLARGGDARAALSMAQAIAEDRPRLAYAFALRAAAGGAFGAGSTLDRIERSLEMPAILAEQADAFRPPPGAPVPDAAGALSRSIALAYLAGDDRPRNYVAAAVWARLGAAAGDAASIELLADLDELSDHPAWAEAERAAAMQAMETWLAR
ncbi:MAG: hypothetical protein ACU0BF_00910 [Paracoccaceae bacterium]